MTNNYTENLSEFEFREIKILHEILTAWINSGLPHGFDDTNVRPAMNKRSRYVFLVNDEYQTAMLYGNRLEVWHNLPYSGDEGFLKDLLDENNPNDLNIEDAEYLIEVAESNFIKLNKNWSAFKTSLG